MTEWRLVREEAREGALNMALDEVAARTAAEGGPRTVRVYRWDPGTLSLGYRQDPATVDWDYCDDAGVDVVRRPTGGGGIYHDPVGDISYAIAAPAGEFPGDLLDCYHDLCEPIFDAFAALGVDAEFASEAAEGTYQPACYLRGRNPAHDVVVDGRKISGNAQYRQHDAVVQHGSLTYATRPERHRRVFADAPDAFDEVASIAGCADASRARAVTALEDALRNWAGAEEGSWTEAELADARALADEKYRSAAWTRERTAPTQSER
ncbi:MAG: biotin/lipoate A/B protein ligase family protein [Halobacteriaceae archaeon]